MSDAAGDADAWDGVSAGMSDGKSLARIKRRLVKDAPSASVNLRLPASMIEELAEIAQAKGFDSGEALIRFYISQGMREDIDALDAR